MKIFIDTNILIDYSKSRNDSLIKVLKMQNEKLAELCVNAVVIAEFITGINIKSKKTREEAKDFIKQFTVIGIGDEEGFLAGKLRREKQVEYMGDALIAATCLKNNLQLMTRNAKHFKNVEGLKFYN